MKKNKPIDFWKPLPKKKGSTKGYAMIPMPFDLKIKPVSKLKKIELNYPQAKRKYPKLNPYGDADRDGTKNWLDCKPFNPKKHGAYTASKKKGKRILLYDYPKSQRYNLHKEKYKHKGDIYRTIGQEAMYDLMKTGKIKSQGNREISYSKEPFGNTLGSYPHATLRVSTKGQKEKLEERKYPSGKDYYKTEQEVTAYAPIPAENIRAVRLRYLSGKETEEEKRAAILFERHIKSKGIPIVFDDDIRNTPKSKEQNIPLKKAKYVSLYHGTAKSNVPSIRMRGILPTTRGPLHKKGAFVGGPGEAEYYSRQSAAISLAGNAPEEIAKEHPLYKDKNKRAILKVILKKKDVPSEVLRAIKYGQQIDDFGIKEGIPPEQVKKVDYDKVIAKKDKWTRRGYGAGKAIPQKVKPETIVPIVKRLTVEAPEKKAMRLRHGATEIKTIDAAEFKRKYEDYRKGYPDRKDVEEHIILDNSSLPWNKIRLEQARSRNFDNAYPEVVIGTNRVEVNDGRHRITAAAEKGQEIDVAVVPEEWTDEDTRKEVMEGARYVPKEREGFDDEEE